MKQNRIARVTLVFALCLGSFALGQLPAMNVGPRHPNLAAAQQHIMEAWQSIDAAQQANEYRLGGHAGRAKELLRRASDEVKLAAMTANRR